MIINAVYFEIRCDIIAKLGHIGFRRCRIFAYAGDLLVVEVSIAEWWCQMAPRSFTVLPGLNFVERVDASLEAVLEALLTGVLAHLVDQTVELVLYG